VLVSGFWFPGFVRYVRYIIMLGGYECGAIGGRGIIITWHWEPGAGGR
jgi:hypothetical protein